MTVSHLLRIKSLENQISELLKDKADLESSIQKLNNSLSVKSEQIYQFELREEKRFELFLDTEREAMAIWFKKLKPLIDPFIESNPDLFFEYRRFNEILEDLTNEEAY